MSVPSISNRSGFRARSRNDRIQSAGSFTISGDQGSPDSILTDCHGKRASCARSRTLAHDEVNGRLASASGNLDV